ncbi:uncharacterized protein ColSpa_10518 [Colletotrichum spaethianum]|uniref:C3H1-type domain-containing protein n=1 Tax=Colletotrichum spaethianum TaxID=700344 RepID=A0AA37PDT0_9PEZI|nr:uncharacterized protein ColSpa_10518 [Colletotrichum spaethianum]GKT50337.1 hypothetical protein ColSpa_10518 [Colletotrichum spaethianum]
MFRPSNYHFEEINPSVPRRVDVPTWRGGYGAGARRGPGQGHYHSPSSTSGHGYLVMESPMPERHMGGESSVDTTCFYAYCLDRGNGNYTRLIPADLLPPLVGIPAVQDGTDGMLVLPPPRGSDPQNLAGNPVQPVAFKRRIDHIVASSPTPPRKPKIYCDKWVHEGVCAFTQQGCKYKHEMPLDKATQNSLGLFHGLPAWWKKQQAELQRQQSQALPEQNNGSEAYFDARQQHQSGHVSPIKSEKGHNGLSRASQSWRRAEGVKLGLQGQMSSVPSPRQTGGYRTPAGTRLEPFHLVTYKLTLEAGLRSAYHHNINSPTSSCVWGPIGPPSKQTSDQSQICHQDLGNFTTSNDFARLSSLETNMGEKDNNIKYESY